MIGLDALASVQPERVLAIDRWLTQDICFVAEAAGTLIGYAALEHSFYERGFIAMLMVAPEYRRQGVASGLMQVVETHCTSNRIFTSTNQSNMPMQQLLTRLGYEPSGTMYHLDEDDPELVFSKLLRE